MELYYDILHKIKLMYLEIEYDTEGTKILSNIRRALFWNVQPIWEFFGTPKKYMNDIWTAPHYLKLQYWYLMF